MTDIVIAAAARTAIGKFGGSLAKVFRAGTRRHRDSQALLARSNVANPSRSRK